MKKEIIYIAADHAGFDTKTKLKEVLEKKGYEIEDLSPTYKEGDDYPDYAFEVGEKVTKNENSKGILICGTGAGMAIAANKVKGIRAAEAYDEYSAKMAMSDNDSNIITLAARDLSFEKIKKIVNIWLKTPFSNEERHDRRIRKIMHYENIK